MSVNPLVCVKRVVDSSGEVVLTEDGQGVDGRFGVVAEETLPPIPAPALPNATLRSRG